MTLLCYPAEIDYFKHFSIKFKIEIREREQELLFPNIGERKWSLFDLYCSSLDKRERRCGNGDYNDLDITHHHQFSFSRQLWASRAPRKASDLISSSGRFVDKLATWTWSEPATESLSRPGPGLADEVKTAAFVPPAATAHNTRFWLVDDRRAGGGGWHRCDSIGTWSETSVTCRSVNQQDPDTKLEHLENINCQQPIIILINFSNTYHHKWYK